MTFNVMFGVYLAWFVIALVSFPWASFRNDSTDAPGGGGSGLLIFVDHKTGVQYVANMLGGMTVLVDADGKPMTVEKDKE